MGVTKDIRHMSKEYLKDPHGQYFKNLDKILKIGWQQGIKKEKIIKHVKDFYGVS